MTTFDFNSAETQANFDVIPAGTIVPLEMALRPGGAGEGGWLKQSRDGQSYMLDCEFTVTEGQYAKRKLWSNFTIEGQSDGHKKAAAISRSKLRAMLGARHQAGGQERGRECGAPCEWL